MSDAPRNPFEVVRVLLDAIGNADWQQVAFNGGPPCFYVERRGRFCLRAKRWDGHGSGRAHAFEPRADAQAREALAEIEREVRYKGDPLSEDEIKKIVAKVVGTEKHALRAEVMKTAVMSGDREQARRTSLAMTGLERIARAQAFQEAAEIELGTPEQLVAEAETNADREWMSGRAYGIEEYRAAIRARAEEPSA